MQNSLFARYKRGLFVGVGAAALFYLAFSLHAELPRVIDHLRTFHWWMLSAVLGLSLANYLLRFVRWEYYLRRLDVRLDLKKSASIFLAGLSMTITPGKAGELLKSVLLKEVCGMPMARTAPVVVAERLTDFIALVLLSAVGISAYFREQTSALLAVGAGLAAGVLLLNNERLSLGLLRLFRPLPVVGGLIPRLEETYHATATLLRLPPLLMGVGLSAAAWTCECLGYYAVFRGFEILPSLGVCVFLYAFSTIAGVVSPGGLGVTDLSLGNGAVRLIPGVSQSLAVTAAFIIRLCTLWFAVLVGSVALMRFRGQVEHAEATGETG